jgi:hypothetical protein
VAIDGSTLALQDTPAIAKEFGRSSNQNGDGAYPLARFVVMVETGTHMIFEAQLGGYHDSEIKLAEPLIKRLKPGMLCLADRLYAGYALWKVAASTGAHLLWRAKVGMKLERIKDLPDGSWLACWRSSDRGVKDPTGQIVRVIEYRIGPAAAASQANQASDEIIRLLTTILDPSVATATELAAQYPQRWEIELTIKEGKTVLRKGKVTLRSKVPDLVKQEFWGMLLAHYLVRKMMAQAALIQGKDPDSLSYQGSIELIKSTQAGAVLSFSP